jgi:hypothetical protein
MVYIGPTQSCGGLRYASSAGNKHIYQNHQPCYFGKTVRLVTLASHSRYYRDRPVKRGSAWQGKAASPFPLHPNQTRVGTRGPARRPCLCDTAQGLFAPLRTSDEGLSRPSDHSPGLSRPGTHDRCFGTGFARGLDPLTHAGDCRSPRAMNRGAFGEPQDSGRPVNDWSLNDGQAARHQETSRH